jgi:hypothetical protein
MIFSENRYTPCANAALRVRIMRYLIDPPKSLMSADGLAGNSRAVEDAWKVHLHLGLVVSMA